MLFDAQVALGFAVEQASKIEAEVYKTKYPAVRYPELVPVDTSGPAFISSVTYFSSDRVGRAQWQNGRAGDVHNVGLTRTKHQVGVEMAAIGYDWSIDEIEHARLLGMDLGADKADAARRTAEEFVDEVALFGDAAKGFEGLTNASSVPVSSAPEVLATATPDEALAIVNGAISGVWLDSAQTEMADTLVLPVAAHVSLATRRLNDLSGTTILGWIRENNVFTMETGRPLTIRGLRGLETAGGAGASRLIAYRRAPDVLKLHMPLPFRFFPVRQASAFTFEVPGAFRLGGVDVRLPKAFRYVDGV